MKKRGKEFLTSVLITVLLAGLLPATPVWASGGISVSVSASTLNIGDTLNVTANASGPGGESVLATMQFSYDSSKLEFVSANGEEYGGGGGSITVTGTGKATLTFRAIAPGSASISVSGWDAVNSNDATVEYGDLSGGGTSVTVNNSAGGGGNAGDSGDNGNPGTNSDSGDEGGGGENANKSSDNSLRSLTISPGTLSPAFSYSVTRYTANVGEDVTSIAVDAQPSHPNATVESVTGSTDLQPGQNTVRIVVKAENGTQATYTIVVNRGGEDNEDEEEEEEQEIPEDAIRIEGVTYEVSSVLPEDDLPEEFTRTTVTYNGEEVEAYSFPYEGLTLLYLREVVEEGEEEYAEGGYFFYRSEDKQFFPYINITVGEKYVLVLPGSYAKTAAPKGYESTSVMIGNFHVDGFFRPMGNSELESEFYLVYGVDKNGVPGWYTYDSQDMSLQRYVEVAYVEPEAEEPEPVQESIQEEENGAQKAYRELNEKYKKEQSTARLIVYALIFALLVAVIVIINLLIFYRKGEKKHQKEKETDYIDFDDL